MPPWSHREMGAFERALKWSAAVLLLAACSRSAEVPAGPSLCAADGDCSPGLVCEAHSCTPACLASDLTSPRGVQCRAGHWVPRETCDVDAQCGPGQICTEGKCVIGCRRNMDCDYGAGIACIGGLCKPAEPCESQADCPYPKLCSDSVCEDRRCGGALGVCPYDLVCQNGRCALPPTAPPGGCGGHRQPCCPGYHCADGCCSILADRTFACVANGIACGDTSQSFCRGNTGACGECGGVAEPCCRSPGGDLWCSGPGAICNRTTGQCHACGGQGQECCRTDSRQISAPDRVAGCKAGLTCQDDSQGNAVCLP